MDLLCICLLACLAMIQVVCPNLIGLGLCLNVNGSNWASFFQEFSLAIIQPCRDFSSRRHFYLWMWLWHKREFHPLGPESPYCLMEKLYVPLLFYEGCLNIFGPFLLGFCYISAYTQCAFAFGRLTEIFFDNPSLRSWEFGSWSNCGLPLIAYTCS